MIVAMGLDGAIGRRGDLIWHLPGDLKRFKQLTTGHPVIMGRKTWESLPVKPLKGRRNIIISRSPSFVQEGAETVSSVEDALGVTAGERPFVIGGAEIYNAMLPYVGKIYLTMVDADTPDADARLSIDITADWEETDRSEDKENPDGIVYRYVTLRRRE